jgi:release factor glutamine methyltransferase
MSIIYEPAEDTYLMINFIKKYFKEINNKDKNILEMGCGNCLISETLRDLGFGNILCSDINKDAVKLAIKKGFKYSEGNLFEKINEKFDFIIFNPPYLPEDNREDSESSLITSGGKKGDEIILEFLKKSKYFLKEEGKIFIIISSLTPDEEIKKYKYKIMDEKKIFFEKLYVIEVTF